jgi:hypothetical protein
VDVVVSWWDEDLSGSIPEPALAGVLVAEATDKARDFMVML